VSVHASRSRPFANPRASPCGRIITAGGLKRQIKARIFSRNKTATKREEKREKERERERKTSAFIRPDNPRADRTSALLNEKREKRGENETKQERGREQKKEEKTKKTLDLFRQNADNG